MISKELHARVIEKLEKVIEIAEDHFEQKFMFPNKVEYKKRGATAGTAQPAIWALDFNLAIFEQNVEDFLARTVPHEMAHLIDSQINPEGHEPQLKGYRRNGRPIYKRDIHGRSWKNVMRVIGADTSRCHSYDVSTVSKKREKFVWVCSAHGTEMKLGPKRHRNQMAAGGAGYYTPTRTICSRACGPLFEYKNFTPAVAPVAIAAQTKSKTPTRKSSRNDGKSIKSQAAKLFWLDDTRATFIGRCVNNLGMKKSTASTYHHNFKSGKWSV